MVAPIHCRKLLLKKAENCFLKKGKNYENEIQTKKYKNFDGISNVSWRHWS
tara:strand:- start:2 stop:154 length:153 start_codon:yes stop_codon:yes gene_type:complete